jgi:hypothetical protein
MAESLYHDYPIGSFLLWDSAKYQEAKTLDIPPTALWIVDGQQRTTAMSLLLGSKPYWYSPENWKVLMGKYNIMVNVIMKEDNIEFALPNPIRRQDPSWVYLRDILSEEKVGKLTFLAKAVTKKFQGRKGYSEDLFDEVHVNINNIWQIRDREVPIVKINHEVEDVAEIFRRLNQAGTKVKEADVVLALAAVRNPGWVRKEYLPYRNDLEEKSWELDAGVFIRTMTGIGYGRARLIDVPKTFWKTPNFKEVWKHSQKGINDTIKRLAEYGITSPDLLPSSNSLIPLFSLTHKFSNSTNYKFNKTLRWFLLANKDGRYTGSAITSLNEDIRIIFEGSDFIEVLRDLCKNMQVGSDFKGSDFLIRYDRKENRFLRLILYLLMVERSAKDWVDDTLIGYDKTGNLTQMGFQPQWHHIFPRSVLLKLAKSEENEKKINYLANITVLNERTNIHKLGNKEPGRYVKDFKITSEKLKSHLIPDSYIEIFTMENNKKEKLKYNDYENFLIERAELISKEANKFLKYLSK